MQVGFVTVTEDTLARETLEKLGREHLCSVRIIEDGQPGPQPTEVAVFTSDRETLRQSGSSSGAGSTWIRAAAHRLESGLIAPPWAEDTTLRLAIIGRPSSELDWRRLVESLREIAEYYFQWLPGGSGRSSPWGEEPEHPLNQQLFSDWRVTAFQQLGERITPEIIVKTRGLGVISGAKTFEQWQGAVRVDLTGCLVFNSPHTDVADKLDPEKVDQAVQTMARVLNDLREFGPFVERVRFVVGGPEMIKPPLKWTLHPFFWEDLLELERKLGVTNLRGTRLVGGDGPRTDQEIADSLAIGRQVVVEEVVKRLEEAVGPIEIVSWTEHLPSDFLEEAWKIALERDDLAKSIYFPRVRQRPWYRSVQDALGEEAGLLRTKANIAVYLAEAMMLAEKMAGGELIVTIDFEVDTQYWDVLQVLLKTICDKEESIILSLPTEARQPWNRPGV